MSRLLPAILLLAACARRQLPPALVASAPYDSAAGVASFDTAWARINATYYDTTFKGHNWLETRRVLRADVERANSNSQVRQAIHEMVGKLGDSHFTLIPSEVFSALRDSSPKSGDGVAGTLGLHIRFLDGRLVVTGVDEGSAAAAAGIHGGWEVVRIGDTESARLLASTRGLADARATRRAELQMAARMEASTFGPAGSIETLELKDGRGDVVVLKVARAPFSGDVVKYGPLPAQYFDLAHHKYSDSDGCVGVVSFTVWMTPLLPALERAMEQLKGCRGVVLDLRGNTGGVIGLLMGTAGFFVDTAVSLGTLKARTTELRYLVNPRRSNRHGEVVRPYSGTVAILVDKHSASATELFTQGMRDIGRVRVFGDTTAGEALPATLVKLANGDVFMHPIADFHAPNGRRVEATGVVPDYLVPVTRRDLLAGRDAALDAALAWVGGTVVLPAPAVTLRAPLP